MNVIGINLAYFRGSKGTFHATEGVDIEAVVARFA